ncbi:hypothetical protein [Fictibacillus enclensis]|uniref:hypothetical protein n=1 Tax=Fictibacillus enclensis TaxID=1017270 RepID=UPI0025A01084|nr:hypothetical protein [Fictibacillus enclensis]
MRDKMLNPLEASVKKLIKEAFEGPPIPINESWFTNTEPNSGIFGALNGVSAEEASISVYEVTLAAHVDHLRYHMWGTNELLTTGTYPKMNWGESWEINVVNELQGNRIQQELRDEYFRIVEAFEFISWNEYLANEIIGSLAHSTYHLGAIRQILKVIKRR